LARKWLLIAAAQFVENFNLVLFLCGFAVLYVGLSSLSRPWANVITGSLVMAVAMWPYLRARNS
jgi:hypothetical protein